MAIVSGFTVEVVDYLALVLEVEGSLGYDLGKFHKYYLDNLHLVEEMKKTYIEEKKKPYISSYPKHFEAYNHNYSLPFDEQFDMTRVGRLLNPEARHYLNFWHVCTEDDKGHFVRGDVSVLCLSALPPWCDPIVKEIKDILRNKGAIIEDYYEREYIYYYHDW